MNDTLLGRRFGRLVVVSFVGKRGEGRARYWLCRCDCGTEKEIRAARLLDKRKPTRSCGCLAKELMSATKTTHGHSTNGRTSPTYKSWMSAKKRSTNPKYANYSGGVSMCERWQGSFEAFLADMGPRPVGTTLDRKDNSKGYETGNCRWATPKEQTANRAYTVKVKFQGKVFTIPELAAFVGVGYDALRSRLVIQKLPVEQAVLEAKRWQKIKGKNRC